MKYIVLIICLCNLFSFTLKAKERPIALNPQPGDSIHVKVTYTGTNYDKAESSGTPAAVAVNSKLHEKEI